MPGFRRRGDTFSGSRCLRVDVAGETETIHASEPNNARKSAAANSRSAVQQRFAGTRQRALIWLVVLAVAGLGTDDALPAQHHKHAATHRKQHVRVHRSKVAKAQHHKHGSKPDWKRHARVRQRKRHRLALATVPSVSLPGERRWLRCHPISRR